MILRLSKAMRWVVFSLSLACILPTAAHAQNILDLLAGEGDDSDQEKQGILPLENVKKRLKETKLLLDKNHAQKQQDILSKRLKSLQELLISYQSYPKKRNWRRDKEILRVRAAIVVQIKALTETLLRLQTSYASIEQHNSGLRNVLKMYMDARKNLKSLLEKKFPIKKRRVLRRVMKRIKRRLKRRSAKMKKSIRSLRKINNEIHRNQAMLERVRKRMLNPPPARRPAPRRRAVPKAVPKKKKRRRRRRRGRKKKEPTAPPPLTRAQRRKLELKQEREQRLEFLTNTLRRQEFSRYRMESIYLRTHKQDEELNKEMLQAYVYLYSYTLYQMNELYRLYAAKAEGGMLHQKPFSANKTLFGQVTEHTTNIITQSHKQAASIWQVGYKAAEKFQKESGLLLLILTLLIPFLLIGFSFFIRSRLYKWSEKITEKMKTDPDGKQFWELLGLCADVTRRLVILSAVFGSLLIVIEVLAFPKAWAQMMWTIGTTVVILRAIWLSANQLLAADPEKRVIKVFDDQLTRRFRGTIKWLSGFALFYMPFLELLRVMEYPKAFYELCDAGFYAVIWLGAILSFMRKAPPEDTSEEEQEGSTTRQRETQETQRRWSLILGYRVYPVLLLIATVVFAIYVAGYRNLAGYLGRAFLLTVFFLSISSTLYQGLKSLVFWVFGLKDPDKGLIKVNTQIAFYISRFSRVVIGVLLGFFTLGLILEAWQVPGGFKAVIKLINYPFLNVKGTRLSFLSIVKFVIVFGSALWLSKWLQKKLSEAVYPIFRMTPGSVHAANTIVGYVVVIVGILTGLQVMGMSIGVLAVFAGVIGIGVGFGLQNIASNFISGLIITFGRPVAVDDVIEVDGVYGIVRKISARSMMLETIDSRIVLVPNSDIIASQVINLSLGPPYVWIKMGVGVSYGSDVRLVEQTLMDIAKEHPMTLNNPAPKVVFAEFNSSSLDFILRVAIRDPMAQSAILSALRFATNAKFDELGIEMPFPQQDLHLDGEVTEAIGKVGEFLEQREPKS